MSKRKAGGDSPEIPSLNILTEFCEGLLGQVRRDGVSPTIQDLLSKSVELLLDKGVLAVETENKDSDQIKNTIMFIEWYSRFAVFIYGQARPDFSRWPFNPVHLTLKSFFNVMKSIQKNECNYFAGAFENLLLSAIDAKEHSLVKAEDKLRYHLDKTPGTFPEITIDIKSCNADSVIIGVSLLLIYFKKQWRLPLILNDECIRVFDYGRIHPNNDLRSVVCQLFTSCSGCWKWSRDAIETFVEIKFGALLNLDEHSIINKSKEFMMYTGTVMQIIQGTKTLYWIETFLYLFIRMAWKSEQEVVEVMKEYVLGIGTIINKIEDQGFLMFCEHSDILLGKIINVLIQEEADDNSVFPVGKMLRKSLELFELNSDQIESYVLPEILIKILTLGTKESQDVFADIMNEFSEIDFKKSCVHCYPKVISSLIHNLKFSAIEEAVEILRRLLYYPGKEGYGPDGWSMLFRNRQVITEAMLNFRDYRENAFAIMEKYNHHMISRNRSSGHIAKQSILKFERSEIFIGEFIKGYNLMEQIIVDVDFKVTNEGGIISNEGAIRSLTAFVNIVKKNGLKNAEMILGCLLKQFMQLREPGSHPLIADLYYAYLDNLDKEDLQFKLEHVCKDLVLLLPDAEVRTVDALKLVVLNKGLSDEAISKLSFFPLDVPALDPIHDKVNRIIQEEMESSPNVAVKAVKISDDASQCKDLDLKQVQLKTLFTCIRNNYLALVATDYNQWMIRVYSNLMTDSREPDEDIRRHVAECMGQIGAIDPSKLESIPYSKSNTEISCFDVGSGQFVTQLLRRLGEFIVRVPPGFKWQLTFNSTIRDLFNIFGEEDFNSAVNQLPPDQRTQLKKAVETTTLTNFKIYENVDESTDKPIFSLDIKYEDWLTVWFKKMMRVLAEESPERKIFEKCAPLFHADYRLAEMLLPCVVYHLLTSEKVGDIVKRHLVDNEILGVISSAIPNSAHYSTFEVSSPLESRITVSAVSLNQVQHSCAQQIFALFDRLSQARDNLAIKSSLGKLSYIYLAHLAYGCQSYARSLSYLEQHVHLRTKLAPKSGCEIVLTGDEIQLLQKNFVAQDDPDGVEGVSVTRKTEPDLMDKIVAHEASNKLEDAVTCCADGVESNPDEVDYSKMMLRCLLSLDQPSTAYTYSIGLLNEKPDWTSKVKPYMTEAAWKLGKWDKLDELCDGSLDADDGNTSFAIGTLLSCIKRKEDDKFKIILEKARLKEMNPISAVASQRAAYSRCYQHLVRLHMLTDIEEASTCLFGMKSQYSLSDGSHDHSLSTEDLGNRWFTRNDSVVPSLTTLEPILSLQRVLYGLASSEEDNQDKFSVNLASSWLCSAKIARKSGNIQRAHHCLLKAQKFMETMVASRDLNLVSEFLVETAKHGSLRLDLGSKEKAVKELSRGIDKHFGQLLIAVPHSPKPNHPAQIIPLLGEPKSVIRAYSKTKLVCIKMTDEMENTEKKDITAMYDNVIFLDKEWEKPYFQLAKLYDRIAAADNQEKEDKFRNQRLAIQNYYNGLKYGCKNAQEALPRLLDIFFEMSAVAQEEEIKSSNKSSMNKSNKSSIPEEWKQTMACVEKLSSNIPSYVIYTAFSQIMSRFNHANVQVTKVLTTLMSFLVTRHPKQVMWRLMVYNHLPADQSEKYEKVLSTITSHNLPSLALYSKMKNVTDAFIELAAYKLSPEERVLPTHLKIFKVFSLRDIPVLVPSEKLMRVTFPAFGIHGDTHKPFLDKEVIITGIKRDVLILSSLAKPKRITLLTSDGGSFHLMVKPRDDLRVDNRTLEFCDVVNRLLKKDPETRKRRLSIRTFSVIPLSTEAGLVEWVDGLKDIRNILFEAYQKFRNFKCSDVVDNALYPDKRVTSSCALKQFQTKVLPPLKPPVFREWFLNAFPDATSWYLARNCYVRSTAVMSMVGYVIGLGDRHLENILLDQRTGEVVHVDFNCLFNRGDRLEVPEVVPFRLTHNMVDAMGLTGYEGHFRRTCEETLRVLRNHRDMLMSVLNPFVFDPFVEESMQSKNRHAIMKKNRAKGKNGSEGMINEDAKRSVGNIKDRLNGIVMKANPFPLSVSGQVNHLIENATDDQRLCKMFVGWASYL